MCEVTSCPDREEGIQGVLEWLLGAVTPSEGDGEGLQWEEGEWLRPEGDGDDVMSKASAFQYFSPIRQRDFSRSLL